MYQCDGAKKAALCVTVLEYVEVFLEMAVWSSSGQTTRWLIVASIQLIK